MERIIFLPYQVFYVKFSIASFLLKEVNKSVNFKFNN